ncbi:hypothetical protein FRUB_08570 [Fimbriiglobus ruber]|uniref:Uncharacterized protein n=1 Tax=Fimbriiglobus ruber TaxID=1908690 RepID=A0A225DIR2_9BACT|nr:hypothetical protein FRUB_08570 [Fimbriiglobus ruber]
MAARMIPAVATAILLFALPVFFTTGSCRSYCQGSASSYP